MLVTEAADFLEVRNRSRDWWLGLVEEGPNKPVAKKHKGDPGTYGGLFPAYLCYRSGSDWSRIEHQRRGMPGALEFTLEFLAPALVPVGRASRSQEPEYESHAQAAEERCEIAYSALLSALAKDPDMGGLTRQAEVTYEEAGMRDRLGNARMDIKTGSYLWTLKVNGRVVL